MARPVPAASPSPLLEEAAAWMVRMREGPLSTDEQRDFECWRQRSAGHRDAWQRAQAVLGTFSQVPAALGRRAIPALPGRAAARRRRLLGGLGVALLAAPLGWAGRSYVPGSWMAWATHRTAIGEVAEWRLPDGGVLVLNTDSAVDVAYGPRERRVRLLAGEIAIETRPDPQRRPFLVETAQGTAEALGTRYLVRQAPGQTRVAVFEGRVALRRHAESDAFAVLEAGQAQRFGEGEPGVPEPVDAMAQMWRQGMLVARDMPLGELVAELARHRHGHLGCSPAVAGLKVTGAFPLRDVDASLALLAETMPVRIATRTRYWVQVEPAS